MSRQIGRLLARRKRLRALRTMGLIERGHRLGTVERTDVKLPRTSRALEARKGCGSAIEQARRRDLAKRMRSAGFFGEDLLGGAVRATQPNTPTVQRGTDVVGTEDHLGLPRPCGRSTSTCHGSACGRAVDYAKTEKVIAEQTAAVPY